MNNHFQWSQAASYPPTLVPGTSTYVFRITFSITFKSVLLRLVGHHGYNNNIEGRWYGCSIKILTGFNDYTLEEGYRLNSESVTSIYKFAFIFQGNSIASVNRGDSNYYLLALGI